MLNFLGELEEDGNDHHDQWPMVNASHLVSLPDTNILLDKFVRCSTCQKYELAPVSTCVSGHPICPICFEDENLSGCLFRGENERKCMSVFLKSLPMGIYHFLHSNSILSCPNRFVGCAKELCGSKLKTHVDSECDFRNLSHCIISNCHTIDNTPLLGYDMHLIFYHDIQLSSDSVATVYVRYDEIDQPENTMSPIVLHCFNAIFMVNIHSFGDRIAMWVSIISQPPGRKYKAYLVLPFKKKPKTENIKFLSDVCKIVFHQAHLPHTPIQEIIDLCECFDMAKSVIDAKFLRRDFSGSRIWKIGVVIDEV